MSRHRRAGKKGPCNITQTININNSININYTAYAPPQDDDTQHPHQQSLAERVFATVSFFSNIPGFVVFLQLAFQFLQKL